MFDVFNLKSKKGFVFSIIAVFLTSIIVVFFILHYNAVQTKSIDVKQVKKLNSVINDFENDLDRGLYITSFRSVIAEIQKVTKTGEFLNDTNTAFKEAMLNSTVENVSLSILDNSSFKDWLDKTKIQLFNKGVLFSYSVVNLSVFQNNYSHITVFLVLDYNVSDYKNKKRFVRSVNKTVFLPIQGLEDPVYYVKSNGRIANIVNFTFNKDIFYLINESFNNSLYVPNNLSPNFLMRLEGNFSNSSTGIESIVNGQRFFNIGILNYSDRSNVDSLYFSNIVHNVVCVNNTPNWFRLDDGRVSFYDNVVVVSC